MKLPHILLCLLMMMSIVALALNGCRRIRPPEPPVKADGKTAAHTQPTTATAPVYPKFVWYTVQQGDTAGRIAEHRLRGGNWKDIDFANPEITAWNKLSKGMKIRLPVRKLKPEFKAATSQPGADVAPAPTTRRADDVEDELPTSLPVIPQATPRPARSHH